MSGKRKAVRKAGGRIEAAGEARASRPTELRRSWGDGKRGRPQIRHKDKRAPTRDQLELFLSVLAETCNVCEAAREVGRPTRIFYKLKQRDSDFRAEWMKALREGYDRLEMEMVRRARFGAPREVFFQGRKTATTRVFNDGAALRLLQLHRQSIERMRAADGAGKRDGKAIFDELAARVREIKAEKAAKAGEVDGGGE